MNSPQVSVIIPTYNRGKFICSAVRSCIDQADCTLEVVIVDDGSLDNTRSILAETFQGIFCDESASSEEDSSCPGSAVRAVRKDFPVIRYSYRQNQGVCAARNYGLALAKGKYVKFLDSDDELIAHAVSQELEHALSTEADVVVTGWQEHFHHADRNEPAIRHVSAPPMNRGIDDMLLGRSPWTAAALYRRSFVQALSWNADFGKADDWGWALTVCLEGASFASLDIESSIYQHYPVDRITSRGNPFLDSTHVRLHILRMVEDRLRKDNALTGDHRNALAQYYYKDAKVLCEWDPGRWRELWAHCRKLAPGFVPIEPDPLTRPFVRLFGAFYGIRFFVGVRRIIRMIGLSRTRKSKCC